MKKGEKGIGAVSTQPFWAISLATTPLPHQKYRHQPPVPDPAFPGKIVICHRLQQERDSSYNKSHQFTGQLFMGATLWL